MTAFERRDLLILRHRGTVWAVENRRVLQVDRDDAGAYRVTLRAAEGGGSESRYAAGARLVLDEVLGVAPEVAIHAAVTVLRRFWPQPLAALAVHDGTPLVVLDPDEPPSALREG